MAEYGVEIFGGVVNDGSLGRSWLAAREVSLRLKSLRQLGVEKPRGWVLTTRRVNESLYPTTAHASAVEGHRSRWIESDVGAQIEHSSQTAMTA